LCRERGVNDSALLALSAANNEVFTAEFAEIAEHTYRLRRERPMNDSVFSALSAVKY
jgi:hypothetical protein